VSALLEMTVALSVRVDSFSALAARDDLAGEQRSFATLHNNHYSRSEF
jgi:hypothetical protein